MNPSQKIPCWSSPDRTDGIHRPGWCLYSRAPVVSQHDDPPKKPGRKPLDPRDPSVRVCFCIPGQQYDDLYQRAQQQRTSISNVIRRSLRRDDDDGD